MVKNPGEAPSIGAIRPLNPPIPTVVVEDELGMPLAVALGTTQPPSAPRKSASVRAEVQKQAPSESGSRSPHSSDDASQNERVASPFRQTPAPTDFSFLGPTAEQSPDTRSIDYMLADTGAQSSLKKIETPPKASSKGGAELPLGAPSASAATGAQPFRFRRSGRTPKSEVSQDAFALEREVSGPLGASNAPAATRAQTSAAPHKSASSETGVQSRLVRTLGFVEASSNPSSSEAGVASTLGAPRKRTPEAGVQRTKSLPGFGVSQISFSPGGGAWRPLGAKTLKVTSIEDQWEIDEEWWRPRPLSRKYYQVLLEDNQTVTLFRDMVNGAWYRQRY